MKRIKTIAQTFVKELTNLDEFISEAVGTWKYYNNVTGKLNGGYVMVIFMHHNGGIKKCEISHTTSDVEAVIKMLRTIEPKVEITYQEVSYKEVTV